MRSVAIEWGASAWVMAAAVAGLLVHLGLCVVQVRRTAPRRGRRRLEALRVAAGLVLFLALLRPELVRRQPRVERPATVVLWDASQSMSTRDALLPGGVAVPRSVWVATQKLDAAWAAARKDAEVLFFDFADGLLPSSNSPPAAADESAEADASPMARDGTDIAAAILAAADARPSLRAILLFSDGDWNTGDPPGRAALALRLRGIPVFAAAVGSESFLPDLAVEDVRAPAYGLAGERIAIPFVLRSHLSRDTVVPVTLRADGRVVASRDVSVPAHAEVQDALSWTPSRQGDIDLSLGIPVLPGETFADNNDARMTVAVREIELRVLVIDSLPRWEYRYLRNALSRDPGVAVDCLLLHPGMAPASGPGYLPAMPDTRDALSVYDVVFLGDVGLGPRELSGPDCERLRGLVEQQAAGLVFLPGRRGRQATLRGTPLEDLMPVTIDPSRPNGLTFSTESRLALTARGRPHFLTLLADNEFANAEVWRRLPGFYWCAAADRTRPGAEVLAVHAGLRNQWGRLPLLATRPFGNGEVLFLGFDAAWRWRKGVEDLYHYRFWGQVVRWMAHRRHLAEFAGMRVFYTPENPRQGQTLHVHATVYDAMGNLLRGGRVTARLLHNGAPVDAVALDAVEGGWGVWQGSLTAREAGAAELVVSHDARPDPVRISLTVAPSARERTGRPARPAVLRDVASTSGGAFDPAGAAALLARIDNLPAPPLQEARIPLWRHWGTGALLLLLLGAYWVGRKAAGMI